MAGFKALLSKKVAGVPVLYLVGFLVIGLAIYAWQTGTLSGPDDNATAETDPAPDSAGGDATGTQQPVFVANPSVQVGPSTDPSLTDPVVVETNATWLRRAVTWLSGTGAATGNEANNALSKYLNGDTLSYDEGVIRDLAIKQYGLPPEPPTSSSTNPKPATRQFSHFPGVHTVKGASDNTYGEIAQLYYGRTDGPTIDLLQATNLSAGHGGPFPIGTKINVPQYSAPKYYVATSATRSLAAIARKNTIAQARILELNPTLKFPVKVGTRVRIL